MSDPDRHSPLPWQYYGGKSRVVFSNSDALATFIEQDDAEFCVRAVNNHERLIQAVHMLDVHLANEYDIELSEAVAGPLWEARQVIAAAKGE